MKKLLLILLCLPLLHSCNSGWSLDEITTFLNQCQSTDVEVVNSELKEELCWCLYQEAKKTYPKGPPPPSEWDKDWAKESARKCLLDIAGEEYLEDDENDSK